MIPPGGIIHQIRKILKEYLQYGFSKEDIRLQVLKEGDGLASLTFSKRIGKLVSKYARNNTFLCNLGIVCYGNIMVMDKGLIPAINHLLIQILDNEKKEFEKKRTEFEQNLIKKFKVTLDNFVTNPDISYDVRYIRANGQIYIKLSYRLGRKRMKMEAKFNLEGGIFRRVKGIAKDFQDTVEKNFLE